MLKYVMTEVFFKIEITAALINHKLAGPGSNIWWMLNYNIGKLMVFKYIYLNIQLNSRIN